MGNLRKIGKFKEGGHTGNAVNPLFFGISGKKTKFPLHKEMICGMFPGQWRIFFHLSGVSPNSKKERYF
jgi:hypothetical protein